MQKRFHDFATSILLVCIGSITLVQTKRISVPQNIYAFLSDNLELNQYDYDTSAHFCIEHACFKDLVVDLGVGDPSEPVWSINVWNKESGEANNLNLIIDISMATQYLPPSESRRWFLKVYDAKNENEGQITSFDITYNGQNYTSTCIPIPIRDFESSVSYIPGVPLELAIARRISIRDFPSIENYTVPEVSWKLLSKVLSAGYGCSSWGRTVPNICGNYPLTIYVCNKTAAYKYNPQSERLELWKEGDYRFSPGKWDRHKAPIEIFIVLDMDKCADIYLGAMEAGCVIQNIYLEANSLGLGTVCVGGVDKEAVHNDLNLPANEYVLYNMPLGHPEMWAFYNFTYVHPTLSNLLPVKQSSVFLEYALKERRSSHDWSETPLTPQEVSQVLWAAYGRSYLKDMRTSFWSFQYQHRVVPSAHGHYSFIILMANSTGVYYYDPWKHYTVLKIEGDKRVELAKATGENWVASAPMLLTLVWNSTKEERGDYAYTEAGLITQNVHLESVAWGLICDSLNISDEDAVKSVLGLAEQTELHPVSLIGVGRPKEYNHKVSWEGVDYIISVSTNSTVTDFEFNQPKKTESFQILMTDGLSGYYNITIPKDLLNGDFKIFIDNSTINFTITQNSTHSFLSFSYLNRAQKVKILGTTVISEQSFALFIAMCVISAIVVIYRTKQQHKNQALFSSKMKKSKTTKQAKAI